MNKKNIFFFLSALFSPVLYAQNKTNSQCSFPVTYNTMDGNNIKAKFYSGGDMHWNLFGNGQNSYEFPKGSGKNAAGAAALWIGGLDTLGNLRIAAMTYRQNGTDFWPGPLDTINVNTNSGTCYEFDVAPVIKASDINSFISDFNNNLTANPNYNLNQNLKLWPANTGTNVNITKNLAPYTDVNNNGIYDPLSGGDYPKISGDQTMYFVSNDLGSFHTESMLNPLGIEVHHTIYSYGCAEVTNSFPALKNTIFHHYRIYNRSDFNYKQTIVGLWSSSGIGDNSDDFAGSNPQKGYAYYYNGDNFDNVYGNILPATGMVLLKAPMADNNDMYDNNGNGIVDEPNEEMSVPNVFYYKATMMTLTNTAQNAPDIGIHYYNYLNGNWKDGSPYTCGGDAYNGITATKHVFPEEVVAGSACNYTWTEQSEGNTPGLRSVLLCTQQFKMKAKSYVEFDYAFISSVDSTAPGNAWASVSKLRQDVQNVKTFFNLAQKPSCIINNIPERSGDNHAIHIFPNPTSGKIKIKSNRPFKQCVITDLLGHTLTNFSNVTEVDYDFKEKRGIYLISVQTENGWSFFKQIVD